MHVSTAIAAQGTARTAPAAPSTATSRCLALTTAKGGARSAGVCAHPRTAAGGSSASSTPSRIHQIEILDGPENLIGFGKELWGTTHASRDEVCRDKAAQLDKEAGAAEAAVLAAVQSQLSREMAGCVTVTGCLRLEMNGLYSACPPHKGVPRFEQKNGCTFTRAQTAGGSARHLILRRTSATPGLTLIWASFWLASRTGKSGVAQNGPV